MQKIKQARSFTKEVGVITIDFGEDGKKLITVVVQNIITKTVLFVAVTNMKAYELARATGNLWLFSRTNNSLWEKGSTSGCRFTVKEMYINCNADSLLYMVEQKPNTTKGVCHNKDEHGEYYPTCYYRQIR